MIRIGLVGAGAVGRSHRWAIVKNPDCTLAAVCDVAEEKAKKLAEGTQAKIYTDYKEMAEKEKLDAVILNLPHFLHKEAAVFFLSRHIPTLVEKPMALNAAECDEMIEASEKYNTKLAVGHVQKYFKCHKYMRGVISSGELGRLCMMTETRNVNYFPNRPRWFLDKKLSGGGILMNYGAHSLDKMLYMTGLPIEKISANGNNFLTADGVEAAAQVLVGFAGGCTAALTFSGCETPFQYDTYFYFTGGAAKIEDCRTLWIAKGAGPLEKVDVPGEDDLFGEQLRELIKLVEGKESEIVTPAYGREVVSWLDAAFADFD